MSLKPFFSLSCLTILLIATCCHGDSGETTNGGECVRIDAALNDKKHIYLFHGDEYLKLDETGIEIRKAPIHEFGGLKPDIDAAVVYSGNGKTYFFKGAKYYKLSWLVVGPYKTSNWGSTFEDGIDAAGNWEGRTYFFKGCNVYRFQTENRQVEKTFISQEVGFPCDVDAAFSFGDSFYVIKGDQVWKWGGEVDNSEPLSGLFTLTSWNACALD